MKIMRYCIFIFVLITITCARKESLNVHQNIVHQNMGASNNSTNINSETNIGKVKDLEGIFIRNNPMAQWDFFKSGEQIYGVGKIPDELLENYNKYSEDGSIVMVSGELHSDEIGPGKNIYPKTIELVKKGDVIAIEKELNGIFNKFGKFIVDNKEYDIAISNTAVSKNYESLIMEYIESGKEVKVTGKYILGKSRIMVTDIE